MLLAAFLFPFLVRAAVVPELITQGDVDYLVRDVNVPVSALVIIINIY